MNSIGLFTIFRREMRRVLRVFIQTTVSPLVSAALYIFIFGYVIGSRIDTIGGVPYISFVFPGILAMNILTAAFSHSSSTLYMGRFMRSLEEVLIAPFSYLEMVLAYSLSAVGRAVVVGVGVVIIGLLFGAVTLQHPFLFLLYAALTSGVFALLGILVGLWAKGFEQLTVLNTFVITPLSYLGGMFYSVHMLPKAAQFIVYANPFFYIVDGIRYSMIGTHESHLAVGIAILVGLNLVLGGLVVHLFSIGWRIRG